MGYNFAIVGASGLVGRTFIKVLEERNLPISSIKFLASKRSAGKEITFNQNKYIIEELTENSFDGVDIALFSAGGETSFKFAPIAAAKKCIVIDNSSAWRRDPKVPLVVPEVNSEDLKHHNFIIANPNCSTIQMVVALKPLSDKYGLKRVVCSTYQSISGAGQKGLDKLHGEIEKGTKDIKNPIAYNAIFHPFEDNKYTNEENKMIFETRKIMHLEDLNITVTCVRLPIIGGHGEAVNVELNKSFEIDEIINDLMNFDGIQVIDDLKNDVYPTPHLTSDKDETYVGRIRRDESVRNGLHLWVVADNLRKGAATNAVQIAEKMIEMGLVKK